MQAVEMLIYTFDTVLLYEMETSDVICLLLFLTCIIAVLSVFGVI